MSEGIGIILKRTREKAGLSQTELSRRLNYKSNATVSRWEHGARAVHISDVIRIAEACDADPNELFQEIRNESRGETAHATR